MKLDILKGFRKTGENDCNQHFLLFQQCFLHNQKKTCTNLTPEKNYRLQTLSIWAALKFYRLVKNYHISPSPHNNDFLRPWEKKTFENFVGKEENAGNQHFLLFPQYLLPNETQI